MTSIIVWLRRDFRLIDNPALDTARADARVIPVYIHPADEDPVRRGGAASDWWLHHSLGAFAEDLKRAGSRLIVRRGPMDKALLKLIRDTGARAVYCNRVYEPAYLQLDKDIARLLHAEEIEFRSFAGNLLFEPWAVENKTGGPYKVFTPFWNQCQRLGLQKDTRPGIRKLPAVATQLESLRLDDLKLLPEINWDGGLRERWQAGERAAHKRLRAFLQDRLADYPEGRDLPAKDATSGLSPHLHFGEITPAQVVNQTLETINHQRRPGIQKAGEAFLREVVWREFTHHVLHHFPHTVSKPLDEKFVGFPWRAQASNALTAWQHGRTGLPLVDAGMRELWHTGYMHNRVRMVVGSLLTKNLGIHWHQGEHWFWDTLVDADLASNVFNWQWIAGCGADAAPYFRIFNPITQSEKFDPQGDYLRRWIPELAKLPSKWIHTPWKAPAAVLEDAEVAMGVDYPEPIVDLKASREEALELYQRHVRNKH